MPNLVMHQGDYVPAFAPSSGSPALSAPRHQADKRRSGIVASDSRDDCRRVAAAVTGWQPSSAHWGAASAVAAVAVANVGNATVLRQPHAKGVFAMLSKSCPCQAAPDATAPIRAERPQCA